MIRGSVFVALVLFSLLVRSFCGEADVIFDGSKTDSCGFKSQFLVDRGITYAYGITANCVIFIFEVTDVAFWDQLMKDVSTANLAKSRCYANDFTVDVQVNGISNAPVLFIMDKHHVVFSRQEITTNLPFKVRVDYDYLLQLNDFEKRGSYQTYVNYAYAGAIDANTFGITSLHDTGFYLSVAIRNKENIVEHMCLATVTESLKYPPALIHLLSNEDWRTKTISQYIGKKEDVVSGDWYLARIIYLWMIALVVSVFTIVIVIITGISLNRTSKANVKLDVAIEALIASSCTNGEHQLKRSALLTKCGFPSIEVIDGQVPIGCSLQDDPNAYQSMNEYDVLAEQIRRVQAAPEPESSARKIQTASNDLSGSQK